jgi:putative ABC transport system substrate-binding protein
MTARRLVRIALLILALLATPLAAGAQQAEKVYRLGVLGGGAPPPSRAPAGLIEALRGLGYVEGRNLRVESRYAEGRPELLPNLAAELAQLNVDVIVSFTAPATAAAKAATSTIPIVMSDVGDPVASGLVASLARPGGNVTGLSFASAEIVRRALDTFKAAVPSITRVAVVRDPANLAHTQGQRQMEAVAKDLGITLEPIDGTSAADLDRVFAAVLGQRPDALALLPLRTRLADLRRVTDFAMTNRLPTLAVEARYVAAGALLTYFQEERDRFRKLAGYIDRILKGAKPGDLAIDQSATYRLVINLKTAKALGLTIPPSVLARADRVIQ